MTKDVKKYVFKPGPSLQVEVVNLSSLVTENKGYLVIPHRTDFYHVFLFADCTPNHLIDFNPVKVAPYSLLFLDKDRIHQFDKKLNYKGQVLIFTDDFFCTTESDSAYLRSSLLFNDLSGSLLLKVTEDIFKDLSALTCSISSEYAQPKDNVSHSLLKNYLHNFLLLCEREKQRQNPVEVKKGPDLQYTLQFKNLLEQHFTKLKLVPAYAEKMHIAEKRLRQATTAILGKTPKELIDERTLLEAKRLLVHEHKTIKEIGFYLGFEEPTNFIKYFRKHNAQTPIEFRQSYLPK